MDTKVDRQKVKPLSLHDAPSLIERIFPAQKISVEAQKERKAVSGQTLTALGSYWKGRKPLVLVRACVLGALLPCTGDDEEDLRIFELLLGTSEDQIPVRFKTLLTPDEVRRFGTPTQQAKLLEESEGKVSLRKLDKSTRAELMSDVLARMPYQSRVDKLLRPEEVPEELLTSSKMLQVNRHLGTSAETLSDLIEQLGIMRFGHKPRVADVFCGGGSIPFEAARLGCDVFASDLSPIACMLTWGSINIIGATSEHAARIEKDRAATIKAVNAEIGKLKVEQDAKGNRAKAYLYCLETCCPVTKWMVPMAPSWVISKDRKVAALLVPDPANKRFRIEIKTDASSEEMETASRGTVRGGRLVFDLEGETYSTSLKTIRGDRKGADGETINDLRLWEKSDFAPKAGDVFQERLYCIQWISEETLNKGRKETFFRGVTDDDLDRERKVEAIVRTKLALWQRDGVVPDMAIEPGVETSRLMRERGWSHWHHLFNARNLLLLGLLNTFKTPYASLDVCDQIDWNSKLCNWDPDFNTTRHIFSNQALNTNAAYVCRSAYYYTDLQKTHMRTATLRGKCEVVPQGASSINVESDIFITDPPYADAVNYHEITELFIAWLRRNPPIEFQKWIWDSRRPLAIKGDGEDFRHNMVEAYKAMANHMPDNGLQIVMFTHQSASVWADMSQIFWGAGLQVMAAWYIATETTSELKKGGYVQGTVILVARKRKASEAGYKDEIVQEVKVEVAEQIDTMAGLNQHLKGRGRIENLFEDADLQMAGYAAALRVLTKYEKIDGTDMTKEALRPRRAGEKNLVGEIIDFAVQVANEHMVPEHMTPKLWEDLSGAERFYFKMMDIETTSLRKLDNYQNFAKAFRVSDYGSLLGSMEPNKARLKTAKEFKKAGFETPEFGASATRAALFAIFELENDVEGDDVLSHLKDMLPNYHNKRDDLAAIADYIARKRETVDETESRAARILHGLIRNERLG
jgi:adenine-specific DNA methylase